MRELGTSYQLRYSSSELSAGSYFWKKFIFSTVKKEIRIYIASGFPQFCIQLWQLAMLWQFQMRYVVRNVPWHSRKLFKVVYFIEKFTAHPFRIEVHFGYFQNRSRQCYLLLLSKIPSPQFCVVHKNVM